MSILRVKETNQGEWVTWWSSMDSVLRATEPNQGEGKLARTFQGVAWIVSVQTEGNELERMGSS